MKAKAKIIIPIILVIAAIVAAVIIIYRRKKNSGSVRELTSSAKEYLQIYKIKGDDAYYHAYVSGANKVRVKANKEITAVDTENHRDFDVSVPGAYDIGKYEVFVPLISVESDGYTSSYTDCYILKSSLA